MGTFEVNPLVGHLIAMFGGFRGVVISKLAAIAIAMGVRKRIWVVNIFYAVIIFWNAIVILGLPLKLK